jgi:hypothetical protein
MRWAQPMKQLFRSKVGMAMDGAITAVAATTTVGTAATTMAGGIIAIGGDFHLGSIAEEGNWTNRPRLDVAALLPVLAQSGRHPSVC